MNKVFYPRIAMINLRNNGRTYVPYLLTCILSTAMFYVICSLSLNPDLDTMLGGGYMRTLLQMGTWIVGFFVIIFLFYTNSFLMKRRKKELGLYNVLGMEKRHIARVILCETLYMLLISLVVGLWLGLLLNRLMFMAVLNLMNCEVPLAFQWSPKAIVITLVLFVSLFAVILLNSLRQIHLSKPIELLRGGEVGEREPKAKWILAILGLLFLGSGYTIAVTTTNPVAALALFFVAVILVILGTYCLFMAGSIALLKILRKNKRYYYHPRHFTSVSGMMYRMKQNAMGLANICILSTAVLVMVSSTLSLYLGMNDVLETRYPRQILVSMTGDSAQKQEQVHKWADASLKTTGRRQENVLEYTYLAFSTLQQKDFFSTDTSGRGYESMDDIRNLVFIPQEDYRSTTGEPVSLGKNEILIYANRDSYNHARLRVFDETFTVVRRLDSFVENGIIASNAASSYFIVVPDMADVLRLYEKQQKAYGENASSIAYYYGFDVEGGTDKDVLALYEDMADHQESYGVEGYIECRPNEEKDFLSLYGGLFFIGIFLGVLFIMATILIIYYKQVSEGYDDRQRFVIMQKVGMSRQEIRRTIHSQVLTVFFMPLIIAGLHMAFAFPFVTRILAGLNMTNTTLFAFCAAGGFLVFALLYIIVYAITAKSYYKVVSEA